MDTRRIEDALKDYKRKKSVIDTTLERIKVYQSALDNPDQHWGIFFSDPIEPGMPKAKGYKGTSSVEYLIISEEKEIEMLMQWIEDEKSRIYPLQVEVGQIEGALEALSKQQRYIIECKYFEGMFWRDIDIGFNSTFRQQNYIAYEGIKKINKEALDVLVDILRPYFERFKTD